MFEAVEKKQAALENEAEAKRRALLVEHEGELKSIKDALAEAQKGDVALRAKVEELEDEIERLKAAKESPAARDIHGEEAKGGVDVQGDQQMHAESSDSERLQERARLEEVKKLQKLAEGNKLAEEGKDLSWYDYFIH